MTTLISLELPDCVFTVWISEAGTGMTTVISLAPTLTLTSCTVMPLMLCMKGTFLSAIGNGASVSLPERREGNYYQYPVSSADNLGKQFGPDQARQIVGPNQGPNCLTF